MFRDNQIRIECVNCRDDMSVHGACCLFPGNRVASTHCPFSPAPDEWAMQLARITLAWVSYTQSTEVAVYFYRRFDVLIESSVTQLPPVMLAIQKGFFPARLGGKVYFFDCKPAYLHRLFLMAFRHLTMNRRTGANRHDCCVTCPPYSI